MNVIAIVFVVLGAWFFISPKSAFKVDAKEVRLFKAKLIGSKKTYIYYRYSGLAFLIIGLLMLVKLF